tara:strand:+ start:136 stop:729 length:594 start_codon:yes stop_codon:yes gene_type:complete
MNSQPGTFEEINFTHSSDENHFLRLELGNVIALGDHHHEILCPEGGSLENTRERQNAIDFMTSKAPEINAEHRTDRDRTETCVFYVKQTNGTRHGKCEHITGVTVRGGEATSFVTETGHRISLKGTSRFVITQRQLAPRPPAKTVQAKTMAANAELIEQQRRLVDAQQRLVDERQRLVDEQRRLVDEQRRLIDLLSK